MDIEMISKEIEQRRQQQRLAKDSYFSRNSLRISLQGPMISIGTAQVSRDGRGLKRLDIAESPLTSYQKQFAT